MDSISIHNWIVTPRSQIEAINMLIIDDLKTRRSLERAPASPNVKVYFKKRQAAKHRILIIEPNLPSHNIQRLALERIGYKSIDIVSAGFEALLNIKKYYYSLILTEIDLPDMNGYKLCQMIKNIPLKNIVTVVALTSYIEDVVESKCFAAGMDGVITKPLIYPDFESIIHQYITNACVS